jgi:hypothetical protein
MERLKYDEVAVASSEKILKGNTTTLVVAGNNSYKNLVGVMVVLTKNGVPYTGGAKVSISDTQGGLLLPLQPYHCIRPGFAEKFDDRIIRFDDVKGSSRDFKFSITNEETNADAIGLEATAVAYFTRNK